MKNNNKNNENFTPQQQALVHCYYENGVQRVVERQLHQHASLLVLNKPVCLSTMKLIQQQIHQPQPLRQQVEINKLHWLISIHLIQNSIFSTKT